MGAQAGGLRQTYLDDVGDQHQEALGSWDADAGADDFWFSLIRDIGMQPKFPTLYCAVTPGRKRNATVRSAAHQCEWWRNPSQDSKSQ